MYSVVQCGGFHSNITNVANISTTRLQTLKMCDNVTPDCENTQTQTQNSQVDWSQSNTPAYIPNIWGRLYSTKLSLCGDACWRETTKLHPEYYDLIEPEFTLGRALTCSFVMKKDIIKENIIKSVSKQHFVIKRNLSEVLSPAIITDLSYNGTYVNKVKIGKGNSRILDDNDEISVTHPSVKIFLFKDLLKIEPDNVPKNISQKYYISRTLGQGACGIVKLVYNKTKCSMHAMKIIKKSKLTNGKITHPTKIMNEVNIMKALQHPCIVSTEEVFDTREAVFIVLELMQGGELFDRITKHGHLTEKLTKFLFRQMVLAVKYLHSQGITHRDLKPENVLLETKDDETVVKITDFGLSKFVGEDSFMKTMCGTPLYLAPEVLRANGQRCYGPEVDVWSLGVILFVCLVGYLPFSGEYKEISLEDQILSGKYRYSHAHWKGVSLDARRLMKKMLTVNVAKRITLDEILNHEWMQDAEIIFKVKQLLSNSVQNKAKEDKMMTCDSDVENNNIQCLPILKLGVTSKRPLNSSFTPCEPLPKKLRADTYAVIDSEIDDSTSTSSCCSKE